MQTCKVKTANIALKICKLLICYCKIVCPSPIGPMSLVNWSQSVFNYIFMPFKNNAVHWQWMVFDYNVTSNCNLSQQASIS